MHYDYNFFSANFTLIFTLKYIYLQIMVILSSCVGKKCSMINFFLQSIGLSSVETHSVYKKQDLVTSPYYYINHISFYYLTLLISLNQIIRIEILQAIWRCIPKYHLDVPSCFSFLGIKYNRQNKHNYNDTWQISKSNQPWVGF